MGDEQVFDELVDTERMFVLQCHGSEQVFEGGDAMSVALELEYEALYPRLKVVSGCSGRTGQVPSARRRYAIVAAAVVAVILVLLMLPIRAIGGTTVVPTAGREYVVQSGDTLASIAARVGRGNVAGVERQLAQEAGSSDLVPGEHLLIP